MNGLDPTADYELYVVQLQKWVRLTACKLLNTYGSNASIKSIIRIFERKQPHADH
jgi:hypothetical protein